MHDRYSSAFLPGGWFTPLLLVSRVPCLSVKTWFPFSIPVLFCSDSSVKTWFPFLFLFSSDFVFISSVRQDTKQSSSNEVALQKQTTTIHTHTHKYMLTTWRTCSSPANSRLSNTA